jgi:iron(III) transport system permease protein
VTSVDRLARTENRRRYFGLARFVPSASQGLGLVCILIAGWIVLVPLGGLFYTAFAEDTPYGPGAFTLANFATAYGGWHIGRLLWNSFVFAAGGSCLTLAMGAFVAWTIERTDMPGREIFHNAALLSFALPGLLTTMAWTLILSPNIGWVNQLLMKAFGLSSAPLNLYSMGGMIWALSAHYFPLAYLLLGPAFRFLDVKMEEAAQMAGANRLRVLTRVTLPLLRPALLSALMLLFVRGLESFEVPRLVAMPAKIDVFTTDIELAVHGSTPQFGVASALSMTLLTICVVFVYLYRRSMRNAEAFATITGKGFSPTRIELGGWRWPLAGAMTALFFVAFGLPLFTLFWQSLFPKIAQPFVHDGGPIGLSNYRFVLGFPIFLQAVKTSVVLAAIAATAVVFLTLIMAWVAQRARTGWTWLIDVLAFAPIAIPGIIVGASVLLAYLLLPIPIYDTMWILLIGYMALFLPYGMRFAVGGLAQIHKELEESAHMSGASQFQVFRRVLAPLLAPAALSAWIYIFVLAVRELGASIMLVGPGTSVLGTVSLTMWEGGGSYGNVCALGMIQILPLIVIVGGLRWLERRLSGAGARANGGAAEDPALPAAAIVADSLPS